MARFTTKFNGLKNSLMDRFDHRPAYRYAQILLLLVLVSITRSPPLTSLFELGLVLLFLFSIELRTAFKSALGDPRVLLALAFLLWIGLTMLWSPVDWELRLDKWWSWRKIVYLPMAVAVFSEPRSKILPIWTIVITAGVYAVLSWGVYFDLWTLWAGASNLIRNHSTQGIYLSFAAFLATYLILFEVRSGLGRSILVAMILLFVSNQLFVLTGRTGYLTLFVLAVSGGWYFSASHRIVVSAGIGLAVALMLALSPLASERIELAVDNAITVEDQDSDFSSLGVRVIFWKNGLELIQERPLLGTGADGLGYRYAELVDGTQGWRGQITDDLHQQYLNIWAEFGLIGLIIFLCCVLSCLLTNINNNPWVFLGSALALSYLANGIANGHFNGFTEGRLIWIFWGAMLAGTPAHPFLQRLRRRSGAV